MSQYLGRGSWFRESFHGIEAVLMQNLGPCIRLEQGMLPAQIVIVFLPALDQSYRYVKPRQVLSNLVGEQNAAGSEQRPHLLQSRAKVAGCVEYVGCDHYIEGVRRHSLLAGITVKVERLIAHHRIIAELAFGSGEEQIREIREPILCVYSGQCWKC